jgi:predicted  nucleic acid-binding Zn-ribbon protein
MCLFNALSYCIYLKSSVSFSQKLVKVWDFIEDLDNQSSNHANQNHVNRLNQDILVHKAQLANVSEALPVIQKRVHGIDKRIQKLSSTLQNGILIQQNTQ